MDAQISIVQFHEQSITVLQHNNQPFVAMRSIVENIGLDWEAQRQRIARHPVLKATACMIKAVAQDGKLREILSLPLSVLNGWLFGIDVNRVRPELREKLTQYQFECFDVLYKHFMPSVAPQIQTATPEQKQHIKSLVIKRVNETGASYSTMWNVVFEAAGFNKLENLTPASYERACAFFKVETLTGEWEHVKIPRLNIPTNDGRYLLVIRGNQTTVINAENHNLIEAVHARKIQRDMQTMRIALQDLSHRMQLLYGDVNDDVVAQPLEIMMN